MIRQSLLISLSAFLQFGGLVVPLLLLGYLVDVPSLGLLFLGIHDSQQLTEAVLFSPVRPQFLGTAQPLFSARELNILLCSFPQGQPRGPDGQRSCAYVRGFFGLVVFFRQVSPLIILPSPDWTHQTGPAIPYGEGDRPFPGLRNR